MQSKIKQLESLTLNQRTIMLGNSTNQKKKKKKKILN